jgi:glycosyltransferase involved in cell wall biosynthesis
MKILLARIAALYGRNGGMEQVEARMAGALLQRGHEVGILSYDTEEGRPYYPIDPSIRLLNLNHFIEKSCDLWIHKCLRELVRPFSKRQALYWRNKGRYSYFREAVREALRQFRPDVIISFDAESSAIFFGTCPNLQIPLITMFHFSIDEAVNWEDSQEIEALKKSSCVQVLLKDDLVKLKQRLPQVQAICIPNVVPSYSVMADLGKEKSTYTIIDVARLTKHQKRPHLLIEAFALLSDNFPQWRVEFWGSEPDGKKEYTQELKHLICEKGLENQVFLRGNTNKQCIE